MRATTPPYVVEMDEDEEPYGEGHELGMENVDEDEDPEEDMNEIN